MIAALELEDDCVLVEIEGVVSVDCVLVVVVVLLPLEELVERDGDALPEVTTTSNGANV